MKQISLEDVFKAISRAESIKSSKLASDIRRTSKGAEYYDNPDTSVDVFIKELLSGVVNK